MSSSSSVETDHPAPQSVDDIDEQWEKFAKDGCPDWWLMAKYTHGWLARTFPYVPFKDCAASSLGDAAAGAPALTSPGSAPTPATAAAALAGRSHSVAEVELLQSFPASPKAPGTAEQTQQQQQQQLHGRVVGLDAARAPAAGDSAPASSLQQQQQNCGNALKGLFVCQSDVPAGVDTPMHEGAQLKQEANDQQQQSNAPCSGRH